MANEFKQVDQVHRDLLQLHPHVHIEPLEARPIDSDDDPILFGHMIYGKCPDNDQVVDDCTYEVLLGEFDTEDGEHLLHALVFVRYNGELARQEGIASTDGPEGVAQHIYNAIS